jgi:uridine kinase
MKVQGGKTIMRITLDDDSKLVMKERCARRFEAALKEVDCLLEQSDKEVLLVAIDGKCSSGKTTLGYYMQKVYDCNLFHMDDFFLQNYQRTPERLSEIGGNVDYERFSKEVLIPIVEGQNVEYRPFNCEKRVIQEGSIIKHKRLNIIEGSYSMHPYFGDCYDMRIFMNIDEEQQVNNIRKRNGEEKLVQFKKEWIPKENAYFEKFDISSRCIIIEWGQKLR